MIAMLTVSPKSLTILQQMFDGQSSTISNCDSHKFFGTPPSSNLQASHFCHCFVAPLMICGICATFLLFFTQLKRVTMERCIKKLQLPQVAQWYWEPNKCWILQILDLKLWTVSPLWNTIAHSLANDLTLGCFAPLPCDLSIPSPPISCGFVAPLIPQTHANTSA